MFRYWGFGLQILSQIEFPELIPAEFQHADLTIELGIVPPALEGEEIRRNAFSSVSNDEYILTIKNICRFYACNGNRIVAEPLPGIDEKSIRLFLLGTVLAAILYQRGCIPMHAAAIVRNGKLTLFAGNSGTGKSTMTALLACKGYDIFTDDICVMHPKVPGVSGIYCSAAYPMIKLWDDAISRLDNKMFSKDFKLRPRLPKYGQFFYETFNKSALPVEKIFILNPKITYSTITVLKPDAVDSFKKLEMYGYKNHLILSNALRGIQFNILSELINNVKVYELIRPRAGTFVEESYDEIKSLL